MYAYQIDENGYIIENYLINGDVPIPEGSITVQLPQPLPFYRPKWNGVEWIEGETTEDKIVRELNSQLETFPPSQKELDDAELELKMITLLNELEVIRYE